MIQRFGAPARGIDKNAHLLRHLRLADVFGQLARAQRPFVALLLACRGRGNQPFGGWFWARAHDAL
jgi:hypothetical protein